MKNKKELMEYASEGIRLKNIGHPIPHVFHNELYEKYKELYKIHDGDECNIDEELLDILSDLLEGEEEGCFDD